MTVRICTCSLYYHKDSHCYLKRDCFALKNEKSLIRAGGATYAQYVQGLGLSPQYGTKPDPKSEKENLG